MAKKVGVDKWLFGVTLLLVVLGLTMIFSASALMAQERFGSAYTFLFRQLAWASAGMVALLLLMHVNYEHYKHPALVFSLLGISTVLLIVVFFADRFHNTHRWLKIGAFSFQPSELAKLVIILFLAYFLENRTKTLDDWRRTLLPSALPTAVLTILVVKQPDLGTALVCMALTAMVLYAAGVQLRYFGYALIPLLPALYLLLFHVSWRSQRIAAWLNPSADPQGKGFHIIQSLIAVGTGGLTGVGLMEGKQKLFYLPEPHTDFIFANIAEELGLLGALTVVAFFAFFCYRGIRTALLSQDTYGRLLATGITSMIAIQAFFNISVVLGLLPTKGIPLPFLSYGGTSIFMTLASVGMLLNISQHTS